VVPTPQKTTYTSRLVEKAGDAIPMHLGYWPDGKSDDELLAAQHRLDEWILARADLANGLKVLDVGCGMGTTLACVERSFSGMTLAGVNNDEEQLGVARRHLEQSDSNSYKWYQADAGDLPFADESFDRVLCVEAAFHFPSRVDAFREMARVLRSGGCIVFTDIIPTTSLISLRSNPLTAFLVEGAIQRGIGPFEHFWENDFPYRTKPAEIGLGVEQLVDLSRETLPSYRCFLGCEIFSRQQNVRGISDMTFAVNVLGALHEAGMLQVVGGVLRKR